MKSAILFLAFVGLIFGQEIKTTFDVLAVQTGLIDEFEHCKGLQGIVGSPEKVAAVAFWTDRQDGNFDIAISAITDGWVGFGVSDAPADTPNRMFNTDVALGFRDLRNNTRVDDMFIGKVQIYCQNNDGVCRDIGFAGGIDNLSNKNLTFVPSDIAKPGITLMKFRRPITAGDAQDFPIKTGLQQYLFAYNSLSAAGVVDYHAANRDSFTVDLFSTDVSCPGNCNGKGTCVKGCCICEADLGIDCNTAPGGGNEEVNQVINSENYPFTLQLDDSLVAHWRIDEEAGTIDVALVCQCTGWVAFGPNNNNQMIGTDATIAWQDPDGTPVINDYFIRDRSPDFIIPDVQVPGGTNDILGSFVKTENGVTTVIFRRKLVTEDPNDLPYVNGLMGVSWAFHPDLPARPQFIQHPPNTKAPITIDFFSGVGGGSQIDQLKIAHGAMMFIIWALAIPATSFIARYLKSQLGHAWFEIHRITNGVAMLMQVAAFVLAVIFVNGLHFDNEHKIIGLIVFILGTVQPILGTIADRLYDPNREGIPIFPDKIHWIIGWLAIFAGLANIPLGIFRFEGESDLMYASIGVNAAIGIFLIIFFIQNLITKWPHSDH